MPARGIKLNRAAAHTHARGVGVHRQLWGPHPRANLGGPTSPLGPIPPDPLSLPPEEALFSANGSAGGSLFSANGSLDFCGACGVAAAGAAWGLSERRQD